ncbi:MAG: phage holin family protein [Candidatus Accumulibacter sp.]|jgi:uncharacterized membrane protein YqjE|nr:phage holin family protein [Accumulibacter sp.]
MGETEGGVSNGLFSALKGIAATLLASGKTRLELLSNEIEVGKLRAVDLLSMLFAMAFCFGIGIVLAVILLVLLFWEQRLAVLAVCALVFLALGGVFLARFRREKSRPERIFAASVAELGQDMRELQAMTGDEPSAR